MLKVRAPREAAVKFLEYLASPRPRATSPTATTNGRWWRAEDLSRGLDTLGTFKADKLPVGKLADTVVEAQKMVDRAGFR